MSNLEAKGGDDENTAVRKEAGGMSYANGFMYSNIMLLGEEMSKEINQKEIDFEVMLMHYTDHVSPSWQHLEGIDMYIKINYDV